LADLYNGKIKLRQATAIAQLGRPILCARDEVDKERRVTTLEKANLKKSTDAQAQNDQS
jgi:hypothetical protein